MDNRLTLSINEPCTEKWSSFKQTEAGGFCGTCRKTVVDFTQMSDDQIINYFKSRPTHTCGRFRSHQLREYFIQPSVTVRPGATLLKAGLVSVALLLVSRQTSAQSETPHTSSIQVVQVTGAAVKADPIDTQPTSMTGLVRGIVKDEYGDPLPGVNVILKGGSIGTSTDANGAYELKADLKEGDVLLFTFIGFKMEEYQIPKGFTGVLDMVMITMELDIMGTVMLSGPVEPESSGLRKWWKKFTALF